MICLIGANGFIGKNLVKRLKECGIDFYTPSIDIEKTIPEGAIKKNTDIIINLAGYKPTKKDMKNNLKTLSVNYLGLINIINSAVSKRVNKIIQISSIMVYEEIECNNLISEDNNTLPSTIYGLSKLLADRYLDRTAKENKFDYIILRPAFVYGLNMKTDFQFGKLTNDIINSYEPEIFGNKNLIRDYIYIDDVTDSIIKAIKFNGSGIFNIGTGRGVTSLELLKYLCTNLGHKKLKFIDNSSNGPRKGYIADFRKAKKCLHFVPKYDIIHGIREMKGYINNEK